MAANYRETVIDGYNLIHKIPEKSVGEAMAARREQLELALARYRRKTRRHVIVVYDGGSAPKPLTTSGAVEVTFSGTVRSADHWIIDHVRALGNRAGMTLVVSSDREIRRNATAYGAKCIDSETFIEELAAMGIALSASGIPKKRRTGSEQKESGRSLSETEIDYWLRLFDGKK